MDVLDIEETVKDLLSSNRKAARFLANLRGSVPQPQPPVLNEGKAPVEVRTSSETRRLVLSGDCPSEPQPQPQPVEARSSKVGDSSSEPQSRPRFRVLIKRKAPEEVRTSDLGGTPSEPRPQPRCVVLNKGKAQVAEFRTSELGGTSSELEPWRLVLNKEKAPAAEIQASELGGSLSEPQPVLTSDLGGSSSESQPQPRPTEIVVDRIPRGREWLDASLLPSWGAKQRMAFINEKASKVEPRASEPQPRLSATIAQKENQTSYESGSRVWSTTTE